MDTINQRSFLIGKYITRASRGVEIGVYEGEFSKYIIENIAIEELILIDLWKIFEDEKYEKSWYGNNVEQSSMDDIYASVIEKFADKDNITILKKDSKEAAEYIKNNYFDWIYIDADHSNLLHDLNLYIKKVKHGGYIICDDYANDGWWGDAIINDIKIFTEENTNIKLIETNNRQAILQILNKNDNGY